MLPDRRQFLAVGIAPLLWRPSPDLGAARRAIRRGELGQVIFCRIFARDTAASARLLDAARFALDEGAPRSVRVEGRFATLHYPGRIICCETGAASNAITFHGVTATLRMEPL